MPKWMAEGEYQTRTSVSCSAGRLSTGWFQSDSLNQRARRWAGSDVRPGSRPRAYRGGTTFLGNMTGLPAMTQLCGFSASVTRQLDGGGRQTRAATRVQSRLDSLSSISPCSSIVSAAAPLRTVTVTAICFSVGLAGCG